MRSTGSAKNQPGLKLSKANKMSLQQHTAPVWQEGVERWLWCHLLTGCLQHLCPVASCGSAGQQGKTLMDRLERNGRDIFAAMGPGTPCHPQSLQEVSVLPVFSPSACGADGWQSCVSMQGTLIAGAEVLCEGDGVWLSHLSSALWA